MSKITIRLGFLLVAVLGCIDISNMPCAAQGVALKLRRHAYYRGESIPMTVTTTQEVKQGNIKVFLDGRPVASEAIHGHSAKLLAPTADVKVGQYRLEAVVHSAKGKWSATESVVVARRPNPHRFEVWAWGNAGSDVYLDHGFTSIGTSRMDIPDAWLARGAYVTIYPCGGIVRRDFGGVDIKGDDVGYKGKENEKQGEPLYNPFSPEVEKARRERNRTIMEAIGDHPAVKMAFYNTEVVDHMWMDNQNREGIKQTQKALGFTRDQRGNANYVAPGVLADDDRGYRFRKYVYKRGNGLSYANQKAAQDIKQFRPDIQTLTDPYREVAVLNMFPGMDMVGTWTYANYDPKNLLYIETMQALVRGTTQVPLQTITLLNYPGALSPKKDGWLLMGPDMCKETSWIVLSRAPKFIGYFYSSLTDPDKHNKPEDQFRVPHATIDSIKEMSDRVYKPYGAMITRLEKTRRRIAVVSSQASRLYSGSGAADRYPNEKLHNFYSVMAMAHLNADVLFDEHVERGELKDYDVLVLPLCNVITRKMHQEIQKFVRRRGLVVSDQYLGAKIPGVIKVKFDFNYRPKVNADAIATGTMYAKWDDQLNPSTAVMASAKGVTAEEDQRIMESYARQLATALAGKLSPEVAVDTPKALVNVLEKNGVRYLMLINDNRTYDERTGKYQAIMEKLVPQTVTVTLRDCASDVYPYDMLDRKLLAAAKKGNEYSFSVKLTELGGKIVALLPARPSQAEISVPETVRRGQSCPMTLAIRDDRGQDVPGLQPLHVTVTDSKGRSTEYTDYYCAENGKLELALTPAVNDEVGTWNVNVEDLTTGITAEKKFQLR